MCEGGRVYEVWRGKRGRTVEERLQPFIFGRKNKYLFTSGRQDFRFFSVHFSSHVYHGIYFKSQRLCCLSLVVYCCPMILLLSYDSIVVL